MASPFPRSCPAYLVFCHPKTGNPYDASKMRKRFEAAVRAAGVRSIRFHDLRHTFGTRMAAAGAPLRNIQEWMGHCDYKTTEIYADYAPDPVQGARWPRPLSPAATGMRQTKRTRPVRRSSRSGLRRTR